MPKLVYIGPSWVPGLYRFHSASDIVSISGLLRTTCSAVRPSNLSFPASKTGGNAPKSASGANSSPCVGSVGVPEPRVVSGPPLATSTVPRTVPPTSPAATATSKYSSLASSSKSSLPAW